MHAREKAEERVVTPAAVAEKASQIGTLHAVQRAGVAQAFLLLRTPPTGAQCALAREVQRRGASIGVSVRLMADVWPLKLPLPQKVVLLALADHAGIDGCNAYPSVARLSEHCSVDPRTVQRALRALEAGGYIVAETPASQNRPTSYRVTLRGDTVPGRQCAGAADSRPRGGSVPPEPSGTTIRPTRRARAEIGTRLGADAVLSAEWRSVAESERVPASEVETVFREFVGYWSSLPGAKARKLDWTATWRNRCIQVAPKFQKRAAFEREPSWRNSRAPVEPAQNIPTADETRARLRAEDEERRRQDLRAQARRVSPTYQPTPVRRSTGL